VSTTLLVAIASRKLKCRCSCGSFGWRRGADPDVSPPETSSTRIRPASAGRAHGRVEPVGVRGSRPREEGGSRSGGFADRNRAQVLRPGQGLLDHAAGRRRRASGTRAQARSRPSRVSRKAYSTSPEVSRPGLPRRRRPGGEAAARSSRSAPGTDRDVLALAGRARDHDQVALTRLPQRGRIREDFAHAVGRERDADERVRHVLSLSREFQVHVDEGRVVSTGGRTTNVRASMPCRSK
jgi:hypothetical protein